MCNGLLDHLKYQANGWTFTFINFKKNQITLCAGPNQCMLGIARKEGIAHRRTYNLYTLYNDFEFKTVQYLVYE